MQLSPQQFLATHLVFSRSELKTMLGKRNSGASESTIDSHLQRWINQGHIKKVKSGVYVHVDRNGQSSRLIEPCVIASKLANDAVLSHHSALELHGLAQSLSTEVTFLTLSRIRKVFFEGVTYRPVTPKAELRDEEFYNCWVHTTMRQNFEFPVTSIERTLVDVLDRPDLAGGLDEVWRSVCSIPALRFRELEKYLLLLKRPLLVAKLGFYLSKQQEELLVPDSLLSRLAAQGPSSKAYFKRSDRGKGRFVRRWNLIVPENLLDEDWEGLSNE